MIIDYEEKKQEAFDWIEMLSKIPHGLEMLYMHIAVQDGDERYSEEEFMTRFYCKQFENYVDLDTIRGCLFGGAIGDALGFTVEFLDDEQIFKRYGENGITEPQVYNGVAHISDDTQMTLFTAEGLLRASQRYEKPTVNDYVQSVYESYLDWLYTQDGDETQDENRPRGELVKDKRLHNRRAPGETCLNSLRSGCCGTFTKKLNDSKGCGGVMRVAPVALYLAQMEDMNEQTIARTGARVAAITHSHELGYIPASFLTALLWNILKGYDLDFSYRQARRVVENAFLDSEEAEKCIRLADHAVRLAKQAKKAYQTLCEKAKITEAEPDEEKMDELYALYEIEEVDDLDAIRELGQGWVAEETLAIALYCAFRYEDDFEKGIIAAANHSGDSDSTAAVTGNILGAYLGVSAIPEKWIRSLELNDVILQLAEALHVHKLSIEEK
ncbi:MAG: ADP-ribosylglycohydrolase family protein [Clostridia bacterium]|nr:ADP-ribosylglycohydrolase family protein [Clostridia bacterium]